MIYVFGDSHRARFIHYDKHRNEVSRVKHLGRSGLTAHGIGGKPEYVAKELAPVKADDVVLFVLGEVDCRAHFYHRHRRLGVPIEGLIDTTVERYGAMLCNIRGYQKAVLDVCPAVRQGNAYGLEFYATREERAEITKMFNRRLSKWCDENDLIFIEIHHLLSDERGFLKKEYEVDAAHVSEDTVEFVDLAKHFPGATWCE